MSEILNSPLILSIVFPMLTAIGILPLLRWALSGPKSEIYASFSITLSSMMAVVCAYGRPELKFGAGQDSLLLIISAVGVFSLIFCLFVKLNWLRYTLVALVMMVAGWGFIGALMDLSNIFALSIVVLVAVDVLLILSGRSVFEVSMRQDRLSHFLAHFMALSSLAAMAYWAGAFGEMYFAIALISVLVAIAIWSIPKFGFVFQENAYFVLALSTGLVALLLWWQGQLPSISLFFVILIFFTSGMAKRTVLEAPGWAKKLYPVIFIAFSGLPAILAIVFFDILRNV